MLHLPSIDELNGEKEQWVVNLEKSLSKEFGKKYINLDRFISDKVRNNQELFFKDNVHYLSAGHRLVG